jgi:hypothetical protein
MISLSFSSGWTARGEQTRGGGRVEVGGRRVEVSTGSTRRVGGGVEVGGGRVEVGGGGVEVGGGRVEVGGRGMGVGAQEAFKNRPRLNQTKDAIRNTCCVFRNRVKSARI